MSSGGRVGLVVRVGEGKGKGGGNGPSIGRVSYRSEWGYPR